MFRLRKWWRFILIIIILVLARLYVSMKNQDIDRVSKAAESATVSQVSVCTKDGKSVIKREDSSLFIVPKSMERIYICGSLHTSSPFLITIYLYRSGADRAFYIETSRKLLPTGPFIIDLISTEDLKGGEYKVDLSIVKEVRGTVRFLIEK